MKRILIVEDELVAAEALERAIKEIAEDVEVLPVLQSIEESVEFFKEKKEGEEPDLVLMDIHLADGLAFKIFEEVDVDCPVVFTTAYDEYALDAYRVGGMDYLLKPIETEALKRALGKAGGRNPYPSHLLIPVANQLVGVETRRIACLYVQNKTTHIVTPERTVVVDQPLESMASQLNPMLFFRANRQYVVSHRAIKNITFWPVSKLALTLTVETPDRIIISKARVREFKEWYTR